MAIACPIRPKNETPTPLHGLALPEGTVRKGNCGIVAVAAAAGVTYEASLRTFARLRRTANKATGKRRRLFGLAVTKIEYETALTLLNVKFNRIFDNTDTPLKRSIALDTWVRFGRNKDPNKLYVVQTSGHLQVVRGLYVMDQTGVNHIELYRLRNKRIKSILEVVK